MTSRSTADMVILILASAVAVILVLSVVLVGIVELAHPDQDPGSAAAAVTSMATVLMGVVVGYVAGRRA